MRMQLVGRPPRLARPQHARPHYQYEAVLLACQHCLTAGIAKWTTAILAGRADLVRR
jgi:hypothetical protein